MKLINLYKVLNVEENANKKEIQKAYHNEAKLHHPDTNIGNIEAEERIKLINFAYTILSNEKTRTQYDNCLDIPINFDDLYNSITDEYIHLWIFKYKKHQEQLEKKEEEYQNELNNIIIDRKTNIPLQQLEKKLKTLKNMKTLNPLMVVRIMIEKDALERAIIEIKLEYDLKMKNVKNQYKLELEGLKENLQDDKNEIITFLIETKKNQKQKVKC